MEEWTPMKALGKAQRELDALGLPPLSVDLKDNEALEFSKLNTYDNKMLADLLAMYGGFKAYLETKIFSSKRLVHLIEQKLIKI